MTSRSIASRSSLVLLAILWWVAPAWAERKIVVLEFEGPKAERFHDDVEAAIEKSAKIVSLDRWLDKAEDLEATKVNARNIKKIARKLKVDGVVMGEVEKRGQRYYLHLKLREGVSGEYVAEVEIVVRSPKLGSDGAKTVKEELIPAIKELVSISGDDDEDDEAEDDDEDEPRARKGKGKGKAKGKGKRSGFGGGRMSDDDDDDEDGEDDEDDEADEDDDEDEPRAKKGKGKGKGKAKAKAKGKAKGKAKAKAKPREDEEEDDDEDEEDDEDRADRDDDDEDRGDDDRVADEDDEAFEDDEAIERRSDDDDDALPVDWRSRAVDLSVGMSVTARRLGFTTANGAGPVQGYRGNPVAGAVVAGAVYPLAFDAKNRSITRNFGLTVLLDRVVKISSRIKYDDMGTEATAVLGTTQQRISAGVVYRQPLGDKAVLLGSVRYNKMKFVIDKDAAPAGVVVQIPNVDYTFVDPGVAVRYLAAPRITVDGGVSVALVLDTGEMQEPDQFGTSKVLGFDLAGGVAYAVTDQIVVRGEARATTFGFEFTGNGTMNDLDGDGTGDVPSGRDTYFGALLAAGYAF